MIGLIPTPAERDAAMLADLREWWARQDLRTFDHKDIRLTREEFQLMLAIADERDDLRNSYDEEYGVNDPPYPPLPARVTEPMPPVDIAIGGDELDEIREDVAAATGYRMRNGYAWGPCRTTPIVPSSTSETQAAQLLGGTLCEHKTGTQEGGAIVCAECGLLIAWIRYDFEPNA